MSEVVEIDMEEFAPQDNNAPKEDAPDLQVNVDGSCFPNPGGDMYGGVYITFKGRKIWDAAKVFLGHKGTNNMAEICIAIYAIKALKKIQDKYPEYNVPSRIVSDSLLIVQAIERGCAKNHALDDKVAEFLEIRDTLTHVPKVIWMKRDHNSHADSRSRL